jgi:adenosine deaminase
MLYSLICGFVIITDDLSLIEVFQFFDLIHNVITDHNIVTRITKEVWFHIYYMNFVTVKFIAIFVCTSNDDNSEKQVIEDFALDNVVYLELRTTPKVIIDTDP